MASTVKISQFHQGKDPLFPSICIHVAMHGPPRNPQDMVTRTLGFSTTTRRNMSFTVWLAIVNGFKFIALQTVYRPFSDRFIPWQKWCKRFGIWWPWSHFASNFKHVLRFSPGDQTGSKHDQPFVVCLITWPISSVLKSGRVKSPTVTNSHQDAEAKLRSSSDVPILRHATSTWDWAGLRLGKCTRGNMESVPQVDPSDDIPWFISAQKKMPNLSGLQELSTLFWGGKIYADFLITFRFNQLNGCGISIANTPSP